MSGDPLSSRQSTRPALSHTSGLNDSSTALKTSEESKGLLEKPSVVHLQPASGWDIQYTASNPVPPAHQRLEQALDFAVSSWLEAIAPGGDRSKSDPSDQKAFEPYLRASLRMVGLKEQDFGVAVQKMREIYTRTEGDLGERKELYRDVLMDLPAADISSVTTLMESKIASERHTISTLQSWFQAIIQPEDLIHNDASSRSVSQDIEVIPEPSHITKKSPAELAEILKEKVNGVEANDDVEEMSSAETGKHDLIMSLAEKACDIFLHSGILSKLKDTQWEEKIKTEIKDLLENWTKTSTDDDQMTPKLHLDTSFGNIYEHITLGLIDEDPHSHPSTETLESSLLQGMTAAFNDIDLNQN